MDELIRIEKRQLIYMEEFMEGLRKDSLFTLDEFMVGLTKTS